MQLRRNEIMTGLLVVGTLAVITLTLILLGAPGLFRPLATYRLYFDNAAGIKQGAPVMLAGRKRRRSARTGGCRRAASARSKRAAHAGGRQAQIRSAR